MKNKIFNIYPALTYDKDQKYEYELYNDPLNKNDRHQLIFNLVFESIEEFFEGISYITSKGWFKKIKFKYSLISDRHLWTTARKTKILNRKNEDDVDFDNRLSILIVVDLKKIENFRELLKNFNGYKTYWVSQVGNNLIDYKYFIK